MSAIATLNPSAQPYMRVRGPMLPIPADLLPVFLALHKDGTLDNAICNALRISSHRCQAWRQSLSLKANRSPRRPCTLCPGFLAIANKSGVCKECLRRYRCANCGRIQGRIFEVPCEHCGSGPRQKTGPARLCERPGCGARLHPQSKKTVCATCREEGRARKQPTDTTTAMYEVFRRPMVALYTERARLGLPLFTGRRARA